MHDLDRTLLELPDPALSEAEEFNPEASFEAGFAAEAGLDEAEELELASEMLGLNEEAELEYFLGKLISKVARKAGRALKSPVGNALVGILKNAARRTLPMAGAALGTMVGGPLGTAIGGRLASQAGSMLGLELEGLSPQDQLRRAERPEHGGLQRLPGGGGSQGGGQRGPHLRARAASARRRHGLRVRAAERPVGAPRQHHRALRRLRHRCPAPPPTRC